MLKFCKGATAALAGPRCISGTVRCKAVPDLTRCHVKWKRLMQNGIERQLLLSRCPLEWALLRCLCMSILLSDPNTTVNQIKEVATTYPCLQALPA